MKRWLNRISYKYDRYAIHNLMMTVVIGMAIVFIADLFNPSVNLQSYLMLTRDALLRGQVWRVVTFIFLPPSDSILWIIFSLYFYYWIGSALENQWGAVRFNLYYLFGVIGAVISCFITGYATNSYLNLSLFFAFAALYPEMQVMLFFVIPVKIKWLAWVDAALFAFSFVTGSWPVRIAILMSLVNFLIFFGPDAIRQLIRRIRNRQR